MWLMDTGRFKTNLGVAIRQRRTELGYSQEAFAEIVGVHRTYQGAVERGERNVSIDNLIRISMACKMTLSELIAKAEPFQ